MKTLSKKIILISSILGVLNGCTALISDSMLKAAHQDMDKNHDGYISYNEYLNSDGTNMKDVKLQAKKKGMSIEEYQKWDFNRADSNRDGKVNLKEFINLARKEL